MLIFEIFMSLWLNECDGCVTLQDSNFVTLSMMRQCEYRSHTTIENPSYFLMTLSCAEAIQSFISHFNQYSLCELRQQ